MSNKVLVSVAWPYANGDLHIGHLAGAYLPADIFARYNRLVGNDVLMVSGSDSHGTPVTVRADNEGVTPEEVFERYHDRFLKTQQEIGISYSLFTHTDTENHHRVAQDMFTRLYENGYLYRETQRLLYSETENRFLPDRYVEGECPFCGFDNARGDQCDNCGKLIDAIELINPKSKTDGSVPVIRETEHFFLDLPKFETMLIEYLDNDKEHWRPNVLNFSRNYITSGLRGRPITRDISWGIPLPLPGWEDKRLYVWFEAVIGYLSASIEWAKNISQPDAWKEWWYNPDALTYYFIGKDNIPFHAIIWPAELNGTGRLYENDASKSLNLPYDVPANEFMNIESRQFSKSRHWAIWLPDLLERYDPDAIRFYVTVVMPETRDSDFDWDEFISRNNNELVATWGNLANRMLGFAYKRFDGSIPEPGDLRPADKAIIASSESAFDDIGANLAACQFRTALNGALTLARDTNRYLDEQAPWFEIKEDKDQAAKTVYTSLRVIDNLKILFSPFLPFSSEKLHQYLGYNGQLYGDILIQTFNEENRSHKALVYDTTRSSGRWEPSKLPAGQKLRKPEALFIKLDTELADQERANLGK
ncbi:MAG: methionine--tRNA ligase [Anaerolineales bacterium]|nr:methionine--tRNA ligase [Anaerolineales bacterium]